MNKIKMERGITLIALIITIVVLLILASVAITAISQYNIISNANSAAESYKNEVIKENSTLNVYNTAMDQYLNGWEGNIGTGGSGGAEEDDKTEPDEDEIYDETVQITVGSYVKYDVAYADMYQGSAYTSKNGWRYLGQDSSGNKLLVSTALPVVVYYHNTTAGGNAKWWDTTQTDKNDKVVQGLLNNFDKIPYAQKTAGNVTMGEGQENTAIGAFAPSKRTYNGTQYNAIGDYFKSSTYLSKISKIRVLTVADIERVNGGTTTGFKNLSGDALGLFDLYDLSGYGTDVKYMYWLATSRDGDSNRIHNIHYKSDNLNNGLDYYDGVRPVIVLSSGTSFVYNKVDKIFEIK